MQTAESFLPELTCIEAEIAIEEMGYKQKDDEIPSGLIQVGGNTLRSEIQKLINSVWNKEELPQQWKESVIVPTYKKGNTADLVTVEEYGWKQVHTKSYLMFISKC
jgi:hypothetical protein